jgi:hypothetical protein
VFRSYGAATGKAVEHVSWSGRVRLREFPSSPLPNTLQLDLTAAVKVSESMWTLGEAVWGALAWEEGLPPMVHE